VANRVAVVDDDPENLRALSALLQAEGFEVAAYAGGETAWAALNHSCDAVPEAIITDLRMPGLDGLALLRRLRERFPTLPVILVSAFPDEAVWREGLEAGALDVFPKPFQTASMIALLRAAIERARPSEAA
jgi:DNA-binding response OmpR family regulator